MPSPVLSILRSVALTPRFQSSSCNYHLEVSPSSFWSLEVHGFVIWPVLHIVKKHNCAWLHHRKVLYRRHHWRCMEIALDLVCLAVCTNTENHLALRCL